MSRITCVERVTKTLIAPPVPAGTIAAFDVATPVPRVQSRDERLSHSRWPEGEIAEKDAIAMKPGNGVDRPGD
jgi:hypothetical protein